MPKPSKQIIIDVIIKGIEQGKDRGNLLATIGKNRQLSQRTFDRHWKTAQEQHTARQQAIKNRLADIDTAAAIDARKKAIMTADERKELLTKIASGQLKVKRPFVVLGKIMEYPEEPALADRLKALAELNKMEGDYAPTKVAQTTASGEDIDRALNRLSPDELLFLSQIDAKANATSN